MTTTYYDLTDAEKRGRAFLAHEEIVRIREAFAHHYPSKKRPPILYQEWWGFHDWQIYEGFEPGEPKVTDQVECLIDQLFLQRAGSYSPAQKTV